uniref:Uncharacterized protein n=1 Tax=Acrobeloides nanus TaxID=290746 RepID=A0A914EJX4_9BILA
MRYFILFIFSSLFILRQSVEGLATNNGNTPIEVAPLEEPSSNSDVQIPEAEDEDDDELFNDFNLLNVSQKYIENQTYVGSIPEAENEDDTNFGNDEPTFQKSNSENDLTVLDEDDTVNDSVEDELATLRDELDKANRPDYIVEDKIINPVQGYHRFVISKPSYREITINDNVATNSHDQARKKRATVPRDFPLGSLQGETFEQNIDDETAQAFWNELNQAAKEENLDEVHNLDTLSEILSENDSDSIDEEKEVDPSEVDNETAKIFWDMLNENTGDGSKKELSTADTNLDSLLKQEKEVDSSEVDNEKPKTFWDTLNEVVGDDSDEEEELSTADANLDSLLKQDKEVDPSEVDNETAKIFWDTLNENTGDGSKEEKLSTADANLDSLLKQENEVKPSEVDNETAKIFWDTLNEAIKKEDSSEEELSTSDTNLNSLLKQAFNKEATTVEDPQKLELMEKVLLTEPEKDSISVEIIEMTPLQIDPINKVQPEPEPRPIPSFPLPDDFLEKEENSLLDTDPPRKENNDESFVQVKPWKIFEPAPRPIPSFPSADSFLDGDTQEPLPILAIDPPMKEDISSRPLPWKNPGPRKPFPGDLRQPDETAPLTNILLIGSSIDDDYFNEKSNEDSDEVIIESIQETSYYGDDSDYGDNFYDSSEYSEGEEEGEQGENIFIKDSIVLFNDNPEIEDPVAESTTGLQQPDEKQNYSSKYKQIAANNNIPNPQPIVPINADALHEEDKSLFEHDAWNHAFS